MNISYLVERIPSSEGEKENELSEDIMNIGAV